MRFTQAKVLSRQRSFAATAAHGALAHLLKSYVWQSGEKFRATAQIAHWGAHPLENVRAVWRLRRAKGQVIAQGQLPAAQLPVGSLTTLGEIAADLAPIRQAERVNLEIVIAGTDFANDWDLWVFPGVPAAAPANVAVCDRLDAAQKELSRGRRVLLLAHRLGGSANARYAAWMPVFWSAAWGGGEHGAVLRAGAEWPPGTGRLPHRRAPRLAMGRRLRRWPRLRARPVAGRLPPDRAAGQRFSLQSQARQHLRVSHQARRQAVGVRL